MNEFVGWVDIVIKADKKRKFQLFALQSDLGRSIMQNIGKDSSDISTVVYIESAENVCVKSEAALRVAEHLGGSFWFLSIVGRLLFPTRALRDRIYDIVAANRYNLLGKRPTCRCIENDNINNNVSDGNKSESKD